MEWISSLAVAGFAGIIGVALALIEELQKRRKKKIAPPSLQEKISSLTNNLESSVAVIAEIEKEILDRKTLVTQLEADTEKLNRIKEIGQPQLEAIAQILEIPIKRQNRKTTWLNITMSFLIAAGFFALGYFLGGK